VQYSSLKHSGKAYANEGSHSFTATHTFVHISNDPSCLSSPATKHNCTLEDTYVPSHTGRRSSWPGWLITYQSALATRRWSPITHASINCARCRVTLLISQTKTKQGAKLPPTSSVTLAMHHRLCDTSTDRPMASEREVINPPMLQ